MGIALLICIAGLPGYAYWAWKRPGWALGVLPFASATFILYGVTISDETATLTCFAATAIIVIETLLIVRFGPNRNEYHQPWHITVTRIINTIVRYSLFLAGTVIVFRYYGPIVFTFIVSGIVHYKRTRRHSILMDVIGTIGTAIRQNLPLPMAMNLEAATRRDKAARMMRTIAHFLTQGDSLSEAIQKGYPRCPAEITSAIAAGEAIHQLPRVIESVEADLMEKINQSKKIRPVNLLYPVLVFIFLTVVTMGLMIFIIPTFAEVLGDISDGQESLPASTQYLFHLSNTVIQSAYLIVLLIILLTGTVYFVWMVFLIRRPEKPRWISRIGDRIAWHLPGVHWFQKIRSTLQLLRILRVGQAGGWPVPVVVQKALAVDMNWCMRSRVCRWLGDIERGEDLSRSARSRGLGHTLAWAIDSSLQHGNVADALEMLEDIYRKQYQYRLNLVNSFVCPIAILIMGTGVGFVIYSMFAAMVSLITLTVQYTVP